MEAKGFKKCKNGHYYKDTLPACPYCSDSSAGTSSSTVKTEFYASGGSSGSTESTATVVGNSGKTSFIGGSAPFSAPSSASTVKTPTVNTPSAGANVGNRTVFGDFVEVQNTAGEKEIKVEHRNTRRLVGWLVSYSFDQMGVDFKLYEGRNSVGRGMDCNITVNDPMMSGKHATILFKNGVYKITDELSSHGTIVNGEDIEDEHFILKDGDVIVMGETTFKFRSSL